MADAATMDAPLDRDVRAAAVPKPAVAPKPQNPEAVLNAEVGKAQATEAKQGQDWERFQKEHPLPQIGVTKWEGKSPEVDPVRMFGSWASTIGILAGALTRQPLTAALNASASAMQAIRANDLLSYEDAKKTWKENNEVAVKNAEWEYRNYQNAFELMKTNHADGWAALKTTASLAHNAAMLHNDDLRLGMSQAEHLQSMAIRAQDHQAAMEGYFRERDSLIETARKADPDLFDRFQKAQTALSAAKDPTARSVAQAAFAPVQREMNAAMQKASVQQKVALFQAEHEGSNLKPVLVNGELKFLNPAEIHMAQNAGVKLEQPRTPSQETQSDMRAFARTKAMEDPRWSAATEEERKAILGEAERAYSKPLGAAEQATNQRLMIAATEMATSLEALSRMPQGTTVGMLASIRDSGSLMDYLKHREIREMSPVEVNQMNVLFQGLGRNLANIEAAGAAQGLQQLGNQMAAGMYINPGDASDPYKVAFRLADMRRIVDSAIEPILGSGRLSSQQQEYARKVLDKIDKVVPYTLADVQGAAYKNGIYEERPSFAQWIASSGIGTPAPGAAQAPEISNKAAFDALASGATYRKPGDPPGQYRVKQ